MTQAEKKQRQVIGRRLADGSIEVIAPIEAVSSRLGAESLSRETNKEQDAETCVVYSAVSWRDGSAGK